MNKIHTLVKLGVTNLFRIAIYRIALKLGLVTINMKIGSKIVGPFFSPIGFEPDRTLDSIDLKIFGWCEYSKINSPIWQKSITSGKQVSEQKKHWSKISDFDLDIGDIKTVWDLSRFDWLLYFAVEYLKTGNKAHLGTLNAWLEDWSESNSVNQGVNWKCGQEASIRVMHLCLVSYLLKQHFHLISTVLEMLKQHLQRISPTIIYAIAQDNNHGTSEAVALYIGGLLLEKNQVNSAGNKWKNQGRYWIENRVKRLIMADGSFSQYSVNYHRVMLDSLCLAEFFRRKFSEEKFSNHTLNRIKAATDWLTYFTDEKTGDAPNIGANDGAKLMPLSNTDYRDYRPTVQLASVLFYDKMRYAGQDTINQTLKLLSLGVVDALPKIAQGKVFSEGGFVYLSNKQSRLFFRYPKFIFRPSQCDAFHVDFWLKGQNILRDAGSYSYNTDQSWLDYFPSTKAHNTIQFDDKEQMPRLSRFLYGGWLKISRIPEIVDKNNEQCFNTSYTQFGKVSHYRSIKLSENELSIEDYVQGFENKAVLRWRLMPEDYQIDAVKSNHYEIITMEYKLVITCDVDIKRVEIVKGWESRYYLKKTTLPVLEVEVTKSAKLATTLIWDK